MFKPNACLAAIFPLVFWCGLANAANLAEKSTDAVYTLSVQKAGSGTGTVTSNVGAISCGMACDDNYSADTVITLTASPAGGNQFTGWLGPCTGMGQCHVTLSASLTAVATFAPAAIGAPTLDIDGNTSCDALTDGLLLIRHLFGLTGSTLTNGAVGMSPTRNPMQIESFLTDTNPFFDIDGNGQADALTDGLLTIRYLFGIRGGALINNAVGGGAIRSSAADIEAWLAACGSSHAALGAAPVLAFGNVPDGINADLVATFTNSGNVATGALSTMLSGDASYSIVDNTCTGTLAAMTSCAVTVRFSTATLGFKQGQLVVSGTPGGSAVVSLTGTGIFQLNITVFGTGTVNSADGKIVNCTSGGGTCSADYTTGAAVLTAATVNGSDAYFMDWKSPSCNGPRRTCTQPMNTGSKNVTASFGSYASSGNLIFASSTSNYNGSSGSAEAVYDNACNALASAAGINNADAPAGNLYMAWISTGVVGAPNARTRLTAAYRGWRRLDGAILADDQTSLFTSASPKFMNAIRYDETGLTITSNQTLLTGTTADGSTGANCTNWTGVGSFIGGDSREGAVGWTNTNTFGCATPSRLMCVMKKNNAAISPPAPPAGAKRIVVTNGTFIPGPAQTPTQRCIIDTGAGYVALIGSIGAQTSSLLVPGTTYIRPDGVVIGTGAEIAAVSNIAPLKSGVFQRADGTYMSATNSPATTYVGPVSFATTGTAANTCNNWTDPTFLPPTAYVGNPTSTTNQAFANGTSATCGLARALYCIQQ